MEKRIFYFEEDMLSLPRFIPAENLEIIQEYFKIFDTPTEAGAIVYPKLNVNLVDRKIDSKTLRTVVEPFLVPYDEVRVDIAPDDTHQDNALAYGSEYFFILGLMEEGTTTLSELNMYKTPGLKPEDIFKARDIFTKFCNNLLKFISAHNLILMDEVRRKTLCFKSVQQLIDYFNSKQ